MTTMMPVTDAGVAAVLGTPDSKRDYNRDLFEVVAPRYGVVTRVMSFGRDVAWKRFLVKRVPEGPHRRCVDLACGTGDLTVRLAQRFPEARVTGIDLTPSMLAIARRKVKAPNVIFTEGDMAQTGLDANSVDIITGGYALRNAPEIATALKEICRILRPGGSALFLDFSRSGGRLRSRVQLGLLRFWGRLWGRVLHGDASVYGYIATSLALYPDRVALHRLFNRCGLRWVEEHLLMGGMLSCLVIEKPE